MTRRALLAVALVAAGWGGAAAADGAAKTAVERGVGFLRGRFAAGGTGGLGGHGLGEAALAGLALLEGGAPATDPAVLAIAAAVRPACLPDQQTYHVALCVLFLDRLGDPADRGLVQLLGVKLYAGLLATGGWTYQLNDGWAGDPGPTLAALQDTNTLRTKPADPPKAKPPGGFAPPPAAKGGKADPPPTGLHPVAEPYFRAVQAALRGGRRNEPGDNSNTQFGLIGLWVAARNGVPADDAFGLIERRFLASQNRDAGWPYTPGDGTSTPAMTCAGLLGLAVGAGRASATPPDRKGPPPPRPEGFAPAPKAKEKDGPSLDGVRNKRAVQAGLGYVAGAARVGVAGLGKFLGAGNEYYLLWSVERVCMAYNLPDLGGADWYQWGLDFLLPAQQADGGWPAAGICSAEVDTCFAVLFLMKSNVVGDLSARLGPADRTLKAGDGLPPAAPPAAPDAEYAAKLAALRDAKGPENTQALADLISRQTGDRQARARQALADRLTRMTANTLRGMLRTGAEEVKRAAATAAGAKGDKGLLPDLAEAVADPADGVGQAAREALKKLTGQDHGPPPGADAAARAKAQAAWRAAVR